MTLLKMVQRSTVLLMLAAMLAACGNGGAGSSDPTGASPQATRGKREATIRRSKLCGHTMQDWSSSKARMILTATSSSIY